MRATVDWEKLVPIKELSGDCDEDTELLRGLATRSRTFLESFKWCQYVERGWFGLGIGGIVGVFLFEYQANQSEVDKLVWVVSGDLPPAYLVIDKSPDAHAALHVYVRLMQEW